MPVALNLPGRNMMRRMRSPERFGLMEATSKDGEAELRR